MWRRSLDNSVGTLATPWFDPDNSMRDLLSPKLANWHGVPPSPAFDGAGVYVPVREAAAVWSDTAAPHMPSRRCVSLIRRHFYISI